MFYNKKSKISHTFALSCSSQLILLGGTSFLGYVDQLCSFSVSVLHCIRYEG